MFQLSPGEPGILVQAVDDVVGNRLDDDVGRQNEQAVFRLDSLGELQIGGHFLRQVGHFVAEESGHLGARLNLLRIPQPVPGSIAGFSRSRASFRSGAQLAGSPVGLMSPCWWHVKQLYMSALNSFFAPVISLELNRLCTNVAYGNCSLSRREK